MGGTVRFGGRMCIYVFLNECDRVLMDCSYQFTC